MILQPGTSNERIVNYSYDDASRLATMTTPVGLFTFGYDQNNQRISLVYPNDVTATYAYDIAGRLTNLSHTKPGGDVITSAGYTLDKVGNRTSKSGATTEAYAYDSIYRILQTVTPRGTENFTYDAVGNRLTGPGPRDTGYQHDPANRMIKGRQYSYAYDNNGNQTGRSTPNADKNWSLTWDYENRLTSIERTKGAEKRTVTFKYDPFGRRIEKKLVTIIEGVTRTTTTTYVYDNEDIALESVNYGATTATTRFIHGPGIDEPLALDRSGQYYFYHHDGLGSVTAITDSSRNVVQRYSYESFGNPRQSIIFRNSYQYTSRERDFETGLHYHRERYYDPVEGRFITKDPIGFEGGVNVYNYTGNAPQNYTDPDGLDPRTPGGGPNETNPVTRCHVNPHNDGYENAIGGAIIGGALIRVAASGFVKLDPPQKKLGPHLHYGPKYPHSDHPKYHFGPKNPNFGKSPFSWKEWFKKGMPWRWKL